VDIIYYKRFSIAQPHPKVGPNSRSTDAPMDALLRWSIENSTRSEDAPAGAEPTVPRQPIDPAVIDFILGKPDSEVMKVMGSSHSLYRAPDNIMDGQENLAVAVDESKSVDERVSALDNFEMVRKRKQVLYLEIRKP
jgi:Nucleotide exchange factor Fes1